MAGLLSPQAGGFTAAPRIGNLITSADVLRSKKPGSYFGGSISSHNPGILERAEQKITGLLSYVLPQKEAAKLARKATSFANDFTPAGDAVTAAQAGSDFRQGNILSGLGNTAIAAIGVVPGVGDVAAKGLKKGIRAYHGSPHDFDKFSLSKIGTGEGAQAYGHGLYFAENPAVAKEYISSNQKTMSSPVNHWVARAEGDWTRAQQLFEEFIGGQPKTPAQAEVLAKFHERNVPGRLYEVNINADPNSLLDWDKPLGAQSGPVQQGVESAARNLKLHPSIDITPDHTGQQLYQSYLNSGLIPQGSPYSGLGQMRAPQMLRDAGIPGLKYLDQGSRYGDGTGTSNFVIFDDSIIDILNKY